jgi:hypothetical protein
MECKKVGRPKKSESEKSNIEIKLRVTKAQAKKIRNDSRAYPSIMSYIRSKLL